MTRPVARQRPVGPHPAGRSRVLLTILQAASVADAASAGTLVVVALSGGAGALLGAVFGQVVQLHRDRKQHEREDVRHERERQQALDDARLQRREDRYVAALDALVSLGPPTAGARTALTQLDSWHRHAFRAGDDSLDAAWHLGAAGEPLDVTVYRVKAAQQTFSRAQRETVLAVLRTLSVASQEAQHLGESLLSSVVGSHDWLTPRPLLPGEAHDRNKESPLAPLSTHVAEMNERLDTLGQCSEALTRRLREELRLD